MYINIIKFGFCSLLTLWIFGCSAIPAQEKSLTNEGSNEKNTIIFHAKPEEVTPTTHPTTKPTIAIDNTRNPQQPKQVDKKTEVQKNEGQWPSETGVATYYAADMEGRVTASGESYTPELLTAAHKTIPLGSTVRVTNLKNNQQVVVRINDRWGGSGNRIINLSKQAAIDLGFGSSGMASVRLDVESLSAQKVHPGPKIQPLPTRIEENGSKDLSKRNFCQNQAEILGLTGDFFKNHVTACMMQKNSAAK